MQEVIEHISDSELQLLEHASGLENSRIEGAAPWSEVKVLAPIPNPIQDVICLGINYMAHAEESARFKKEAFEMCIRDRADGIPARARCLRSAVNR